MKKDIVKETGVVLVVLLFVTSLVASANRHYGDGVLFLILGTIMFVTLFIDDKK